MPVGNAYLSGHLVPSPIVGLACAPIVETRFLELAMSLLDFFPWYFIDFAIYIVVISLSRQSKAFLQYFDFIQFTSK